jgi:hypothetical protein
MSPLQRWKNSSAVIRTAYAFGYRRVVQKAQIAYGRPDHVRKAPCNAPAWLRVFRQRETLKLRLDKFVLRRGHDLTAKSEQPRAAADNARHLHKILLVLRPVTFQRRDDAGDEDTRPVRKKLAIAALFFPHQRRRELVRVSVKRERAGVQNCIGSYRAEHAPQFFGKHL